MTNSPQIPEIPQDVLAAIGEMEMSHQERGMFPTAYHIEKANESTANLLTAIAPHLRPVVPDEKMSNSTPLIDVDTARLKELIDGGQFLMPKEVDELQTLAGSLLAAYQPAQIMPWSESPLSTFSIVGMNHYHANGGRRLFVAMTRFGKCIKAEGADEREVFADLLKQAEGINQPNKSSALPDVVDAELVERVAEAICRARNGESEFSWDYLPKGYKATYLEVVHHFEG